MSEERREKELAAILGVSRDSLRTIRKTMAEEADWLLMPEGITYTEAGFGKLRHALEAAGGAGKAPERAGDAALVEVVVSRLLPHPKRLLCLHGEQRVVVQVRDNTNFMAGMKLTVKPNEGLLWHYRGRMPKRKGRL